jgi:hypothetical protein
VALGSDALLRLLDSSEVEHGQTAGLGWRRTITHPLVRGHVDKRLQFIIEVALGPLSMNDPTQDGREAMKERHAAFENS